MSEKLKIFISACEPSADVHCGNLIRQIKSIRDDVEFVGIGGEYMQAAGCELLENPISRAAMLHNVIKDIGFYKKLYGKVKKLFKEANISLVVVCDSPAFNFHIAKLASKKSIKTFFYIAPQLWAWAPWRIKKLKKWCDTLACILPFEQKWFESRGVMAKFIGNPLLAGKYEQVCSSVKTYENYDPQSCKIALVPGSRGHEIESIWPAMCEIALKIKEKFKDAHFTVVAFNEETQEKLKASQPNGLECDFSVASVRKTACEFDFTLVTSGSACLEVASAGCPMAVMYQSNKYLWHIVGKRIVRMKNLSLVNILADRDLVPEFMPYFNSTEPIYTAVDQLLRNPEKMQKLSNDLVELTKPLARLNAQENAANLINEMINQNCSAAKIS